MTASLAASSSGRVSWERRRLTDGWRCGTFRAAAGERTVAVKTLTSFTNQQKRLDSPSFCLLRTSLIEAHSNRITGCDVSADRKHLATVSLDSNVKVRLESKSFYNDNVLMLCKNSFITGTLVNGMIRRCGHLQKAVWSRPC